MSANPMIMSAGRDARSGGAQPQFGVLVLNGSAPLTLPVVNIAGSGLDTDRPVTATTLNATGAARFTAPGA